MADVVEPADLSDPEDAVNQFEKQLQKPGVSTDWPLKLERWTQADSIARRLFPRVV